MEIKIRTVSGKEFVFNNSKYKNIMDWLKGNFKSQQGVWWKPCPEMEIIIMFNNIESIEMIQPISKINYEEYLVFKQWCDKEIRRGLKGSLPDDAPIDGDD